MKKSTRYWDSVCFLAWLKQDAGRTVKCKAVLKQADDGLLTIVTSALTLAEVIKLKKNRDSIPADDKDKVIEFFQNPYISIRNVDRKIAERARELTWEYSVDPKDAIHVATAEQLEILAFDTFDDNLIRRCGDIIELNSIRFGEPDIPLQEELEFDGT